METVSSTHSLRQLRNDYILRHVTTVKQKIVDRYNYHKTVSELSRLSDKELRDLGLTRNTIEAAARKAVNPNTN